MLQEGPVVHTENIGSRAYEGVSCLLLLFSYYDVAIEKSYFIHKYVSGFAFETDDIVRVGRLFEFNAKARRTSLEKLQKLPLPLIGCKKDGGFFLVAKILPDRALIVDGCDSEMRPVAIGLDELTVFWSGDVVLFRKAKAAQGEDNRFGVFWFFRALKKYKVLFSEVIAASLFLQILSLITPMFFQVVVDKVLDHHSINTLEILIIGMLTVSSFEGILGGLRTYVFSHTTNRVDVELGAQIFRKLQSLPIAYFQSRRVGVIVSRLREIDGVRQFLTGNALTTGIDLIFVFVFLGVMCAYSSTLTIIVALSLPAYALISILISPILYEQLMEKFRRGADNQSTLVEVVSGAETVKALCIEPYLQRRWEDQLADYVSASFKTSNTANWANQIIQTIGKVVMAVVLYFGAMKVMDGAMSVGELIAFNMLSQKVANPVLRIAQMWPDFQQVKLSVDRLGDIMNSPSEPGVGSGLTLATFRGSIRFEDVRFRYSDEGGEVLKGINLDIAAGTTIGIVGPSGSGKSTITKLLQRSHLPTGGRILLDGLDLGLADPGWVRSNVGVVLQESVLFNLSIRDNIAISRPGSSLDEVIAAAELSGAHDFICGLQNGYDTKVGERGASLSGGQRQRIAIARALISNPKILIFDEATSALDYESELVIQKNLADIGQGRTVVIVAHRLSTVRHADRIITIEGGRIVEDGAHSELLMTDGRYARLHRIQLGLHHETV